MESPRNKQSAPAGGGNDTLLQAHRAALAGNAGLSAMLRGTLPPDLAYTGHLLDANAALDEGEHRADWLASLNRYLERWRVAPVTLDPQPSSELLNRLDTGPLAPINGGPKVSVILATHDAAGTVAASVRSILKQRWQNLELIAVDDASRDGTAEILHDLAQRDARMRVLVNPVNVGAYVSRNIALQQAQGDWITLQDADDWSHPERLSRHLRSILKSTPPPPVSALGMLRMTCEGRFAQLRAVGGQSMDGALQYAPTSPLFQAEFLRNRLGSWDCARFGADSEMMARAAYLIGKPVPRLAQFGLIALDHPGSLTGNPRTGVHPDFGVAPARQAYRQAWRRWQAEALTPDTAYLSFPPKTIRFSRPPVADVKQEDIDQVVRTLGNGT